MEISATLRSHIRSKRAAPCTVYPAPFAVFLNADDKTYVEPDISVICDKNKLSDRGCEGAPDFVIEIVSPGSRRRDYGLKNALYTDAGVRLNTGLLTLPKSVPPYIITKNDAAPMVVPFSHSSTMWYL